MLHVIITSGGQELEHAVVLNGILHTLTIKMSHNSINLSQLQNELMLSVLQEHVQEKRKYFHH